MLHSCRGLDYVTPEVPFSPTVMINMGDITDQLLGKSVPRKGGNICQINYSPM